MPDKNTVSLLGEIANYTEILAKDPHSTVFVPLCETYRKMGLLDDALEIAERGIETLPMFSPGYTALGRIHAQRGAFEEASAAFAKAIDRDKESLAAIKGLARVRIKTGDQEAARGLLERVLTLKPDDEMASQMLTRLGGRTPAVEKPLSSVAAGGVPEAEKPRREEGPRGPGGPISTPTIAELYIRQGFPQRAVKVYRDLLQDDPHNESIRRKLVELKKRIEAEAGPKGQESKTEPALEEAVENASEEVVELASETAVEPSPGEEEPPRAASASPAEVSPHSGTVAEFERWLEAIRRRREDVQ